jgi:hypothetical protein
MTYLFDYSLFITEQTKLTVPLVPDALLRSKIIRELMGADEFIEY